MESYIQAKIRRGEKEEKNKNCVLMTKIKDSVSSHCAGSTGTDRVGGRVHM